MTTGAGHGGIGGGVHILYDEVRADSFIAAHLNLAGGTPTMAIPTKIFIGSSHEALKLARAVKQEIDNEYTEAIIWDSDGTFPLGLTLLETIESLPLG